MLTAKPLQAGDYTLQVMIFDVRCGSNQPIRCAGREVVDCLGTLASRCANGGSSRTERSACIISRLIQFPAGGPAQLLDRLFGLFAKLRRRFRYCL